MNIKKKPNVFATYIIRIVGKMMPVWSVLGQPFSGYGVFVIG